MKLGDWQTWVPMPVFRFLPNRDLVQITILSPRKKKKRFVDPDTEVFF